MTRRADRPAESVRPPLGGAPEDGDHPTFGPARGQSVLARLVIAGFALVWAALVVAWTPDKLNGPVHLGGSAMRALVVYESILGNTEVVARAVAEGLGDGGEVEVVEVGAAPTILPAGVDLLVIGGPTHAHGMTNPDSRRSAAQKAQRPVISSGIGIREWLAAAGAAPAGVAAAPFDTRIKGPGLLWGSAAKAAAGRLEDLGFRMAASPESFLLKGPTGPVHDVLVAGEIERARRWGAALAAKAGAAARR